MKAIYTNGDGTRAELDVIEKHKDGTVDLGRGEDVLVRKATVGKEAKPGLAFLLETKSPKSEGNTAKGKKAELQAAIDAAKVKVAEVQKFLEASPEDPVHQAALESAKAELEAAEAAIK